jgi:hypothetical protein
MRLVDLPRNDPEAVVQYLREHSADVTPETVRMLLMLQDDPDRLRRHLDEIFGGR